MTDYPPPAVPHDGPHRPALYTVPARVLRHRLGRRTWQVWNHLCDLRDRDDADTLARDERAVHITNAGLARAVGVRVAWIERCVQRLRQAGLMGQGTRRTLRVPTRLGMALRAVWCRPVVGVPADRGTALVPWATLRWLGRVAGDPVTPPSQASTATPVDDQKEHVEGGSLLRLRPEREHKEHVEGGPTPYYKNPNILMGKWPPAPDALRASASGEILSGGGVATGSVPTPLGVALGTVGQGTRPPPSWTSVVRLAPDLIPPEPTMAWLPGAKIPDPPLVPPGLSDEALVRMLGRLYLECVRARGGGLRAFGSQRATRELYNPDPNAKAATVTTTVPIRDPNLTRHRAAILAGGRAMENEDIAPALWIADSVDTWIRQHGAASLKVKPPPPKWVFLLSRMEDWHHTIQHNPTATAGGRVVMTTEQRELYRDWLAMQRALIQSRPATRDDVQRVVAEHFPHNTWSRRVAAVRAATENERRAVQAKVQRGEFIW